MARVISTPLFNRKYSIMARKVYTLLLTALMCFSLMGCDELFPSMKDVDGMFDGLSGKEASSNSAFLEVKHVEFSPNYKHFFVDVVQKRDIGPYDLSDSTVVKTKASETIDETILGRESALALTGIENVEAREISKLGIKMLVLADLTLGDSAVAYQRETLGEMRSSFGHDNLFVAFMYGDSLTETMPVTDYVISNYFVSKPAETKLLYRSVLAKKSEMTRRQGVWANAKRMTLVILSDAVLYQEDNAPIDPDHFILQQQLLAPDTLTSKYFSAYYVNISDNNMPADNSVVPLKVFCQNTGGVSMDKLDWTELKNCILGENGRELVTYRLQFVNPDGKVYRSVKRKLELAFYDAKSGKPITSTELTYSAGKVYDPIIVNGPPLWMVVIKGCVFGLVLMGLVYLVFQIIIPYVRYRLFLKKYVIEYQGGNMSVGNVMVSESCYLCKDKFEEGDQIVVKCEHTMHKSCWDENEYHCPEYGRHCQEGSHYYNRHNLLDFRNASFYLQWIMAGLLAALLAWVVFTILLHPWSDMVLEPTFLKTQGVASGTPEALKVMDEKASALDQFPLFGLLIGFFLTFGLAAMAISNRNPLQRIGEIFIRSILAAVCSYLIFALVEWLCFAFGIEEYEMYVDLIPWTLSSFVITYVSTAGTRIRLKMRMVLASVALSVLSMLVWNLFFSNTFLDFRVLLLLSFFVYAVSLAVFIAQAAPRSERYFLRIQGAVKETDVALYKWFLANPEYVVSIGHAAECALQMSWDVSGYVAPHQADVVMYKGAPCLIVLEEGVFRKNQKPLKVGDKLWLSHGVSFVIGKTTFTYIEKDS